MFGVFHSMFFFLSCSPHHVAPLPRSRISHASLTSPSPPSPSSSFSLSLDPPSHLDTPGCCQKCDLKEATKCSESFHSSSIYLRLPTVRFELHCPLPSSSQQHPPASINITLLISILLLPSSSSLLLPHRCSLLLLLFLCACVPPSLPPPLAPPPRLFPWPCSSRASLLML